MVRNKETTVPSSLRLPVFPGSTLLLPSQILALLPAMGMKKSAYINYIFK